MVRAPRHGDRHAAVLPDQPAEEPRLPRHPGQRFRHASHPQCGRPRSPTAGSASTRTEQRAVVLSGCGTLDAHWPKRADQVDTASAMPACRPAGTASCKHSGDAARSGYGGHRPRGWGCHWLPRMMAFQARRNSSCVIRPALSSSLSCCTCCAGCIAALPCSAAEPPAGAWSVPYRGGRFQST